MYCFKKLGKDCEEVRLGRCHLVQPSSPGSGWKNWPWKPRVCRTRPTAPRAPKAPRARWDVGRIAWMWIPSAWRGSWGPWGPPRSPVIVARGTGAAPRGRSLAKIPGLQNKKFWKIRMLYQSTSYSLDFTCGNITFFCGIYIAYGSWQAFIELECLKTFWTELWKAGGAG